VIGDRSSKARIKSKPNGRFPVKVGVVVIGRNEGMRLRKCLDSLLDNAGCVVYVDSGSTDGSAGMARAMGVEVVDLDMRIPFTAARARNEGFWHLRALTRDVVYVQFVDGDCELLQGWMTKAAQFLDDHKDVAAVCGRLREKHPEQTVYNMLCDIEWDRPVGEAKACGGISMMRAIAFESVQGFRGDVLAGEEPELCVRLRAAGWRIWRLGDEMALHDAAMRRFGQWWTRSKRAGHAFAEGAWLHGAAPERHYVSEARRALVWGVLLPIFVLASALVNPLYLGLLCIYPLQVIRIATQGGVAGSKAWWRAAFLVLGKFPEGLGQLSFLLNRILRKRGAPIEYK
jgi:GT2 family glycosyltransferase